MRARSHTSAKRRMPRLPPSMPSSCVSPISQILRASWRSGIASRLMFGTYHGRRAKKMAAGALQLSWRSVSDSKLLCVEKITDRGGRRSWVFLHETMTADLHADVQPRQQLSRPAGSRCDERISLRSVDEQHRTLQLTQRVPWVDRMVEDFGFQPFRTGERPLAV